MFLCGGADNARAARLTDGEKRLPVFRSRGFFFFFINRPRWYRFTNVRARAHHRDDNNISLLCYCCYCYCCYYIPARRIAPAPTCRLRRRGARPIRILYPVIIIIIIIIRLYRFYAGPRHPFIICRSPLPDGVCVRTHLDTITRGKFGRREPNDRARVPPPIYRYASYG